jgi:large subunit ribosomal protein L22
MEVKAVAKNTGLSSRKVRMLLALIKDKPIAEALSILRFQPSPAAQTIAKVVKSAAANAENNFQLTPGDLRVVQVYADDAPLTKRFQPRARGRADRILKRSSHITVVVAEQEA